jgi:hypothetical protein
MISPPFSVVNVNGHQTPPKQKDLGKMAGVSIGSASNSKTGIDGKPLKLQGGGPASANQYNMYRQSASTYFHHNNGSERRNSSLGVNDEGGSVSG